jgi:23S rRNA pseudouridine1911/1915/1917 synthase
MELIHQVTAADHGKRAVDVLIARTCISRMMSKRIRLHGELLNNGRPWRMIDPVACGDLLIARTLDDQEKSGALRRPAGIEFVYCDEWLVIVNKPAGLVVHPTRRQETGTLTDLLADYPLHPVSRLDRGTSGLVMIARNSHAHYAVMHNPLQKVYWALVHGRLSSPEGLIDAPIGRSPGSIIQREVRPDGASARTKYRLLHYFPAASLSAVRFELLTGRTHQIRVHSQFMGHPLVGDTLYGLPEAARTRWDRQLDRQALHAIQLSFTHPVNNKQQTVAAPLPPDLRLLLRQLA